MMETIGLIGGSGLYDLPGFELVKKHIVETPYGLPSGPVVELLFEEKSVFFLARHGEHHELLPHELNYRANVYALKSLGVTSTLSISAVGSLREEVAPGHFLFPDQLIDWTLRKDVSFLGNGLAGYPASADPFSKDLSLQLSEVLRGELSGSSESIVHNKGTYICIEGPHLSTRAESEMYRGFGADIIGMTACPEVRLAFEAQMKFALVGLVSDYDCWKEGEEDVSVANVMAVLQHSTEKVKSALPKLIRCMRGVKRTEREKTHLTSALMHSPEEAIAESHQPEALKVLFR